MFIVLLQEDCLSGASGSAQDMGAGVAYAGLDGASARDDSRGFGHDGVLRMPQPA